MDIKNDLRGCSASFLARAVESAAKAVRRCDVRSSYESINCRSSRLDKNNDNVQGHACLNSSFL